MKQLLTLEELDDPSRAEFNVVIAKCAGWQIGKATDIGFWFAFHDELRSFAPAAVENEK